MLSLHLPKPLREVLFVKDDMSKKKAPQGKSSAMKIAIVAILVIFVASGVLVAMSGLFGGDNAQQAVQQTGSQEVAVIVTNMGTIVFKFYPNVAPKTVESFKNLADSGFYNGTKFHRVIPDFMIQGGDPNSRDPDRSKHGMGGPGYSVPAEFSSLQHKRGIVSMARRGDDINSAGSQFFIVVKDSFFLDGQYTIFGEVIQGMDVVDKIVNVRTDANDNPIEPVIMQRVYIQKG